MQPRKFLVTLAMGSLLAAVPVLAQTTPGGSSGTSDPAKAGQGAQSTQPSTTPAPSATSPSTPGSGSKATTGQAGSSTTQPGATSGTGATTGSSPATGSGSTMSSGTAGSAAKQGAKAAGDMSADKVKQLQEALKAKGHDPGPIDGVMGPKTRAALDKYQKAENIQNVADAYDKLGVK
jgi:Putative peptidoglycan binding domain